MDAKLLFLQWGHCRGMSYFAMIAFGFLSLIVYKSLIFSRKGLQKRSFHYSHSILSTLVDVHGHRVLLGLRNKLSETFFMSQLLVISFYLTPSHRNSSKYRKYGKLPFFQCCWRFFSYVYIFGAFWFLTRKSAFDFFVQITLLWRNLLPVPHFWHFNLSWYCFLTVLVVIHVQTI